MSRDRIEARILFAVCFCHLLNDMLQSLLGASYPALTRAYQLSFSQVGLITLAYQLTASLLQPLVGLAADRRPTPGALPCCTLFTMSGLLALSLAPSYPALLAGACVLGVGSSLFHPESSRVARMASGGRHGLAQSLFQVGGTIGSALGPLGAAVVVERWGQRGMGCFSLLAVGSAIVLVRVASWYARAIRGAARSRSARSATRRAPPSRRRVGGAITVLLVLVFSKYVYLACISSYYTFFLMERFSVSVQSAQVNLFVFLAASAAGTFAGGPIGDRFGRKRVIWVSILGVLPFTVAMGYASLTLTVVLSVVVGFLIASAFPAIVVYGHELVADRVGLISGLFYGFSFGAAGAGAAAIGQLADRTGIVTAYRLCALLPALGMLTALLPEIDTTRSSKVAPATADNESLAS